MIQQIRLIVLIPHKLRNGQRDQEKVMRKESLVHMLCPFLGVPLAGTLGVSWHWQVGIISLQGFCHKTYGVTSEPQIRRQHLVCAGVSFNQSHTHKHAIELLKYSRKRVF